MLRSNLIERNLKFNLQQWISEVAGRHFVLGLYNSMTIRGGNSKLGGGGVRGDTTAIVESGAGEDASPSCPRSGRC